MNFEFTALDVALGHTLRGLQLPLNFTVQNETFRGWNTGIVSSADNVTSADKLYSADKVHSADKSLSALVILSALVT